MIRLYALIAGNFWKPLGFKIAYGAIALWALLAAWRQTVAHDLAEFLSLPILGFFVFLPTVFLADMGILYLKEQLSTWQSSLVPHYRRPHLIVGALFVAMALCAIPLLFNQIVRMNPLPIIALCAAAASLAGWLVYDPSLKTIGVFFAALALACFPAVQQAIGRIVHGESPYAVVALLTGSIVLFGWIWWKLSRLHEEMPEYRAGMGGRSMTPVRPVLQTDLLDTIAGLIARYPMWRIGLKRSEPIDSALATLQHRRLVSAGGWVPWRLGALWALAILGMLAGINLAFDANDRMKLVDIAPLVLIISMPAAPIIISSLWIHRGPMLPYEMTLPASRRSFVRQTLAALVWDHVSCWIGAILTCMAIIFIVRYLSKDDSLMHSNAFDIAITLAFFFSGQVAAVGIIAWTLRFRSKLLSLVTMIVAVVLTLPPLLVAGKRGLDTQALTLTIASFTIAGLVALFDAYRRWLRVNLE
jgi:hypothetical protein